jgi:tryptophanyl-tRNA synthetase
MTTFLPLVFSGMQPTGNLHLGNYLGAIVNWVAMQNQMPCVYCVVDMHAITVQQNPLELKQSIREVTAAYVACGIDPQKSIIFNQSQVSQHAELGWVFNCVARLGWLNRMTQFKEKAGKDKENASVGLYTYPNLMAADILLYKATHVPVGEDQKQHLELARDIAQKFNKDFNVDYFPQPAPMIQGPATRVMSLRDGLRKMSKSEESDYSRINLTDSPETIALKFKKAKTDLFDGLPSEMEGLKERPEIDNLVGIFAALKGVQKADILADFGGGQFSRFKQALADCAVEKLSPITVEMTRLMGDVSHIDGILRDGAARARVIASKNLTEVKNILGFIQ